MWHNSDTKDIKLTILFNSLLRWLFGMVFLAIAYYDYGKDGWWVLLLFGIAFIITGFIRPKRCINNTCNK